jgi:hypothetical protein
MKSSTGDTVNANIPGQSISGILLLSFGVYYLNHNKKALSHALRLRRGARARTGSASRAGRFIAQRAVIAGLFARGADFLHPAPCFVRFVASRWLARERVGKVQPYQLTYQQEPIMKVRKNLEAVFLAAAVVANFANYAVAKVPAVQAGKPAQAVALVADQPMQVVVVKGHRLTAAEKAALN